MVPIPRAASWEELNLHLEAGCLKRRQRRLRGHRETIAERFESDRAALLPLPAVPYEACEKITTRVTSLSLVRYRSNDYSVPTEYGHRQVLLKGYVHQVVIICGSEVIARHERSYERESAVFDPLHYLRLLEHKSRALEQAAPLAGWQLPDCFLHLRRLRPKAPVMSRCPRATPWNAYPFKQMGTVPPDGGPSNGNKGNPINKNSGALQGRLGPLRRQRGRIVVSPFSR